MKLFVTGGTGFIGSHFLNQAHSAGHELVALRRSAESKPRIPLHREPRWLDCAMDEVRAEDLAGCEAVVHLAAHSLFFPYDTIENCLVENVMKPMVMLRAAIAAGVKKFVIAGSCFEYGYAGERYEEIPVNAPLEPTASYSGSKAAATVAFHTLAAEEKLEMQFLRIFQVYGEGEAESRFWPSLLKAALAGEDFPMSAGEQVRDFVNVEEVAARFVRALEREVLPGVPQVHHVGSGHPMSLAEFAKRQWEEFGGTGKLLLGAVPMRQGEVMRFVPEV